MSAAGAVAGGATGDGGMTGPVRSPVRCGSCELVSDADALVARVDARGLRWDLYRTHDRRWLVRIEDGYERSYTDDSMTAALAWAVDAQFLPRVPPPPGAPRGYEARRSGSGSRPWQVVSDGGFLQGEFATKRAAGEAIERTNQRERDAVSEWTRLYARVVDEGTPGVDFYWSDSSGHVIDDASGLARDEESGR